MQKEEPVIKKENLREIPMFSELNTEQLREVFSISILEKYTKGEMIFLEGDGYRGFYIVLKGSVKVFKSSPDGKEFILHLVRPPHAFADVPLFEGGNYPANAQTLEECVLLFIPKAEFLEIIRSNSSVSLNMLAGFAKRLRSMSRKAEGITLKEVSNRLSRYLLEEIKKNKSIDLPEPFVKLSISKSTLASYLGTITETLSRTFKRLQDDKVIRMSGKTIFIADTKKLRELAK